MNADAPSTQAKPRRRKLCFVTVGATAPFNALLEGVITSDFLHMLSQLEYTNLRIQCGEDGGAVDTALSSIEEIQQYEITIEKYDFRKDGLTEEMGSVVAQANDYQAVGCVISHAGSGTILDALRVNAPLIVVPNPTLLENHQEELAEELARQEYVVHCNLKTTGDSSSGKILADALKKAQALKSSQKSWPPVNSGESKQIKSLDSIIDNELGFVQLD